MPIQFFYECHTDHVELLPTLTVGSVKCDACDEDHGISISIGWLVFAVGIALVHGG